MSPNTWMIYGANGYTGRLCAELAAERGLRPWLAGRNEREVRQLAERLGLPWRAFALDDPRRVRDGIEGVDAVLHTAGPFSATSAPMAEACIASSTHYLDITGEISVFEDLFGCSDRAEDAGIAMIPGVGFDVVPTDGVAALLHRWMPEAEHLDLAFFGLGRISAGTARSMVEALGRGGLVRRDGALHPVPSAHHSREVPFPTCGTRTVTTIPWGDLSTAFRSTAIPNIRTYTVVPRAARRTMPTLDQLTPVLQDRRVQRGLKWLVNRTVQGPDETMRREARSDIWGEVRDAAGNRLEVGLTTPEGYHFTAVAAVAAVTRLLQACPAPTGTLTPSLAFGADFVLELPGVTLHPFRRNGEAVTTDELQSALRSPTRQ